MLAINSIVADVARNVGGDLIEVSPLLPLGTDPHTFNPSPRDLVAVADAHLILANGLGLEAFLNEMLSNSGTNATIIEVSSGVETRQMGILLISEHHEEAEVDEHSDHLEADPHTWTSPNNVIIYVDNIEAALSELDPNNATHYKTNANTYKAALQDLDAWIKSQIETIPLENRKLVTNHAVFGYYAERYGLEQVGVVIPAFSTAVEPSAQQLAALETTINTHQVKAIFIDNTITSALAQRIAEDTGIQLFSLYTGSLGPPDSGAETYLAYSRYNTKVIVEALR